MKAKKAHCPTFKEQTEVTIFGDTYIVTDLSHEISPNIPTLPGHLKTVMWRLLSHEDCIKSGLTKEPYSYQTTGIILCDHTSTHVDALNHVGLAQDARSIDKLPFEWFITPGVWLDFSHKGPNAYITRTDIEEVIKKTEVKINPQSTVLINTGWYKQWNTGNFYKDFPILDPETAQMLVDKGAKFIACDLPLSAEVHLIVLGADRLLIENLANLDAVTADKIKLLALPLKVRAVDGAPARVVAMVE